MAHPPEPRRPVLFLCMPRDPRPSPSPRPAPPASTSRRPGSPTPQPGPVDRSGDRPAVASVVDPGWLFLIAGLAMLVATVLISAQNDLRRIRWQRDRVLALEAQRSERIRIHAQFLQALERREPRLVRTLAAAQLSLVPTTSAVLGDPAAAALTDASVFPDLEPGPVALPEFVPVDTLLGRMATDESTRMWVIAASGVCVLVGLLSPWRRSL